jgi:hypothetical protein
MPGEDEDGNVKVDDLKTEEAEKTPENEEADLDYKALFEASEIENKKLLNDSRATQGNRNRTQDLEDRMNRMESSVEMNARASSQILGKMTKEDDEFAAEVKKENQDADAKSRAASAGSRRSEILNEIMSTVQVESEEADGDPVVLISKDDQDKLSKLWGAATAEADRTGDTSLLHRVQMEANRMVLDAERAKSRQAVADVKAQAKLDTKKALERAGIADQDTGPARSGAGGGERKRGTALIEEALKEGNSLFPGSVKSTPV